MYTIPKMLEILIPGIEFLLPSTCEFVTTKDTKIQIEHSLLSVSKWESKYNKPFLGDGNNKNIMDSNEFREYVKCMTITKNVNPNVYFGINDDIRSKISKYIGSPMTATTFSNTKKESTNTIITAEIIYYEMIMYGIPFECQKWHLNRLMTLIRVCAIKQSKPEKVPYNEMIAQRRALNQARLKGRRRK